MSDTPDKGGGGGERKAFLSAHRCPEVDLLPLHDTETRAAPPCSPVPAERSHYLTCTGRSESEYLDVSSTCRCEEEQEEGSLSDWSEEDLSLHFSPSVILPSDDEESDPESGFQCVDVTVETQVKGQDGETIKMVPKRQIHLKKKKDTENINDQEKSDKLQEILRDGPAGGRGANSEVSANELLCPPAHHRSDLLLRQHSMPSSFQTHLTPGSDVDSCRVYRGLIAAASQGLRVGRTSEAPRRLQKSFSLDETKTKMASCIIKSVLSKKMQVEQINTTTSQLKVKREASPIAPPPADQRRARGGAGGNVFKAPVHVVRDVRSLVKNTYSLSFATATPENNKPTSFKVIGQEVSPPPTYQQAVGVRGHQKTKTNSVRGHVAKVAALLSQSQERQQSDTLSRPIAQQRRGSEPIISRGKVDDVTLDPPQPTTPPVSQSERARGAAPQDGTSLPPSAFIHPPPSSAPRHLQETLPPVSDQEKTSVLLSAPSAPDPSQHFLHSGFFTPSNLHPHLGHFSYVHSPLNYIHTQLHPPPPTPNLQLLKRSEENQNSLSGDTSDQNSSTKTCPPQQTRTTGDRDGSAPSAQTQEQHLQQQPFLCGVQGFLPAQVGSDFLIDLTGSAAPPGALLSGPAPYQVMLEPKSGQCFYVEPPRPQRKMLLDPETGQFVPVLLSAAGSAPSTAVFPVCCTNPAPTVINPIPTMLQVGGAKPTVLSVMRIQPSVAFSPLYAPPCLPFALHTPSGNFTHTAP